MKLKVRDKVKILSTGSTGVIVDTFDTRDRTICLVSVAGNIQGWIAESDLEPLPAEPQAVRLGGAPIGALVKNINGAGPKKVMLVMGRSVQEGYIRVISVLDGETCAYDEHTLFELVALPGYDALALAKEGEE